MQSPAEAGVTVAEIKAEAARIGRPIPDDHYGATILFKIGKPSKDQRTKASPDTNPAKAAYQQRLQSIQAIGEPDEVLARIREFAAQGVTKFIAIPMAQTEEEMIQQCRLLSSEVIPHAND